MRHARTLLAAASALALVSPTLTARADTTAQSLPFSQNWSTTTQITTTGSTAAQWTGVPGVTGYLGDLAGTTSGVDPQTLTGDTLGTAFDVIANQSNPTTLSTGGVAEFDGIANPTIALNGSGTADAPHILIVLNTTGQTSVRVRYNVRDLDGSADNAAQQVALMYRVGSTGAFTNLTGGYVADATTGGAATQVTPIDVTLPAAADNQTVVQLRIVTTNAAGADEWVGIDDISITGTPSTSWECGNGIVESAGEEGCDDGNTMDGDCCSSFCQVEDAGTLCREAVDFECDVAEFCDGESPVCPADALEPDGTLCGFPKGGPPIASCDAQDTCEAGFCVNQVEPAGTPCRSAAGVCDLAEVCDGSSDVCPSDGLAGPSVVCRAAAGPCDAEERCSGSATTCPGNTFLPGSTVCRASAGSCDSTEFCTGSTAMCPTDSVLPLGTACRASTGACDPAESCNGFATCPADRTAADGTACADGTVCNGAETCMMGSCRPGTALSCDDRNACTADACAEPGGCENTAIAGCCNVDRDCADDGDVCTAERCSGTGGMCERLPVTGCCTADSDCTGGTACTMVSCNLATNRCESAPVPSCCTSDADCTDGLACTSDSCNRTTGVCSNSAIADCCAGDGDCDDGDACSTDSCTIGAGGAGTCTASPILGCCLGDSDCMDEDGSACTTPSCNTTTERCIETLVRCDDMDECTSDTCEVDGSCSHTPVSCDDMDDCTADACSAGACEHTPIDGCGMMPDAGMMMDMDAGMPMPDAALPDAGLSNDAALTRIDAPVDTGPLEVIDTGIGTGDGGPIELMDTSGCDRCAATPDRSTRGLWLALGVLGLVLARTRTRRRVR
jgi:cysteine-rich repeat protein